MDMIADKTPYYDKPAFELLLNCIHELLAEERFPGSRYTHILDELDRMIHIISMIFDIDFSTRRTGNNGSKTGEAIAGLACFHLWRLCYVIDYTNLVEQSLNELLTSVEAKSEMTDQWCLRELMEEEGDSPDLLNKVISKVSCAKEFEDAIACALSIDPAKVRRPAEEIFLAALLQDFSRLTRAKRAQTASAAWLDCQFQGLMRILTLLVREYRTMIADFFRWPEYDASEMLEELRTLEDLDE